ncbi:YggT family protein [Stenotrophobium rhamnosiphilum]|uniref:YggT family protein n=1 Tax=Stenotrophobium rhamnosiphilum TaxID=2029166 RepID=A0A2T5MIB5_9GAMM|nr:YggT family protein [Stenotrophobium rhamnosiphilum]PTU32321.1 YggT family protein [Stenotrophobium rhamnosiphilum]
MGANADNAIFFLVTTIFDLAMWLLLLRILLQWVRADFYNPMSQLVWQTTRYPTDFLRKFIPRWRNLDTAAVVTLLALAMLFIYSIGALLDVVIGIASIFGFATLKILVLTVNLYTFTLFVQAILSWLGPGVNNPASNVLWSLNEPLLRPVRRIIPPLSGLDLAPLVLMLLLQVVSRLIPLPGLFR